MDAFTGLNQETNNYPAAPTKIDDYHEEITYDPNGNIKTYLRNGDSRSIAMDKLGYNYIPNTNKLNYVTDDVTEATPADYKDMKNQSSNNYGYDAIGNMIRDNQEGISKIDWTVYGKIQQIIKTNGSVIKYSYDPSGNRISKIVTSTTPAISGDSTYYVRDASGNVMSVYNKKNGFNLVQKELPIYGSSRLGVYNVAVDVQNCPYVVPSAITIFTRGSKFFELSNHLGNVLATITDKKVQHTTDKTTIDYYTAEVSSATDYYPFGMQMPGRNGSVTGSGSYTPTTTTTTPTPPITAAANLVVNNRPTNTPAVYEATNSITFEVNFASTTGDIFEARILEVPEAPLGGNTFGGGVWSSGDGGVYRYGFNGKEQDNDAGEGIQDYGMRIYNEKLGRFLSVDPLTDEYPWYTPYQFAGNTPIQAVDLDGLEEWKVNGSDGSQGAVHGPLKDQKAAQEYANSNPSQIGGILLSDVIVVGHKSPTTAALPPVNSKNRGNNFERFQSKVFNHEGGYVNDLADPGGATNKGIIFSNFKHWSRSDLGVTPTMGNLKSLTNDQAVILYKKHYWDRIRGDEFENGSVAFSIYDWSITSGGSVKELEKLFSIITNGITVDSKFSSSEVAALNKINASQVFDMVQERRLSYYQGLINQSLNKYKAKHPGATEKELKTHTLLRFKKGWENRVNGIIFENK